MYRVLSFIISSLLLFSGCSRQFERPSKAPVPISYHQRSTVFVHGSLFPFINKMVKSHDIRQGFYHASESKHADSVRTFHNLLNEADPEEFPLSNFYYFGWTGELSYDARHKAAENLYDFISKLPHPITLIGHSHHGNVILELARVADERGDTDFIIDRIILTATPIQGKTAPLVYSDHFKEAYLLYSVGDLFQVGDPQGLHAQTPIDCPYLFSGRVFDCNSFIDHIYQARILMGYRNPSHISFLFDRFISNLPTMLKLMKAAPEKKTTINVPKCGEPFFVERIRKRCGYYYAPKV